MTASSSALRLSMTFLTASWIQRQHVACVSAWSLSSRDLSQGRRSRPSQLFAAPESAPESVGATAIHQAPAKFVPFPFQYRQEIEIEIESLTNQGLGIARVPISIQNEPPKMMMQHSTDTASQLSLESDSETVGASAAESTRPWVVMVPNVITGERVIARVFRNYPSYSEADFVRVVGDPSPDRILQPPCPISEECGGCQYQHISIDRQRSIKTDHTKEAFQQYGLLMDEKTTSKILQPCTGTSQKLEYRSKLTPHYDAPRKQATPAIGFLRQMSQQVIDVESCIIATPQVNVKYQQTREELIASLMERHQQDSLRKEKRKSRGATLLFRQGNIDDDHVTTNHKEMIRTTVDGIHFDYWAGNFFQNNNYVLPLMVNLVLAQVTQPLEQNGSSSSPPTHMIDCYCGSGLFAISCAARAKPAFTKVIGIEINDKAIDEATHNAATNGLTPDQVSFVAASAENIFAPVSQCITDDDLAPTSSSADFPPHQTVVVIDPPRKGCSPQFLELLLDFGPARVVYVSCNVVTQGRDAKILVDAGYECTYIQPLDLFPQTRHVECVATFEKR